MLRSLALAGVAGVCLSAEPSASSVLQYEPPPGSAERIIRTAGPLLTDEEFAALARTDPVRMLEAAVRRYRAEVRGFRAVMHKQERIAGTLYPPEAIRIAVRENPYAALMLWTDGARTVRVGGISFGTVEGVLYAAGENGGNVLAWRPGALFGQVTPAAPFGDQAKLASRYAITEAGPGSGADRTRRAWEAAQAAGRLNVEYLGTKSVPEVGGRVCHVLRRTCDPAETDPFVSADPAPNPVAVTGEAFRTVTLMIDAETWLQLGSELRRADGELVGAYFFRDVELNPPFGPDQFKPAALKK